MIEPTQSQLSTTQLLAHHRKTLSIVGLVILLGVALSLLWSKTGIGIPCVIKSLTGWDCPGCGATRMGAAVLRGDLAAAFTFNPALFIVGSLAAVVALVLTVAVMSGHTSLISQTRRRLRARGWVPQSSTVAAICMGAALAWMIARNVLIGPL